MNMQRHKSRSKKQLDDKVDVYSTIKNFERLPCASFKIARDDLQPSEVEENYDISYDMERSYMSKGSNLDSKNTVFQEQIEFKAKRRKYQTDVRAKESAFSESSSAPIISPEKEKEPDQEREIAPAAPQEQPSGFYFRPKEVE